MSLHLGLGAIQREVVANERRDDGEGFALLGIDLEHRHQDGAEPALHRRADFALLEGEGGVGHGRIDDP